VKTTPREDSKLRVGVATTAVVAAYPARPFGVGFRLSLVRLLLSLAIALLGNRGVLAQTVVLDDFENGMRVVGGINNLWIPYTGEGGIGITSIATGAAHDGSDGLQEILTAGTAYMHFFAYDGIAWKFAHEMLSSGTWTTNKFNRMSFWVKHPATMKEENFTNGKNIELGTYTRCQSCDRTTQNAGGTHYYHYYNVLPNVWTYVIVDNHPQHSVGGPSTDPGIVTSPTSDGPTWNYFDSLTRWYWNAPYIAPTSYPATFQWDSVQFYVDPNPGEDVAHIASMEASYNPATNKLHIGFVRNASQDNTSDTTYTARYAFADIWALGFNNALPMGSVGPDGLGDYVNKKIESTTLNLSGHSMVFIAVQKQGRTDFRQIAIPISPGSGPVLQAPANLRVVN